ncbi:MAG: hypothetical protein IT164_11485 [Bryobacterales bacterium]|nr:hypothetical protein [Bryobacterales bacterium]
MCKTEGGAKRTDHAFGRRHGVQRFRERRIGLPGYIEGSLVLDAVCDTA